MFKKLIFFVETVGHLRWRQIVYQIRYRLSSQSALKPYSKNSNDVRIYTLTIKNIPALDKFWDGNLKFHFLNIVVAFETGVDWNYQGYGKLWNYNLQYANYLQQADIADEVKAALMRSQYEWLADGRLPLEPYPVSLRAMNMMRWISRSKWEDTKLVQYLYTELEFLSKRLEYHLLGNHLLENAFALMMGGAFFGQEQWATKGRDILEQELEEQVLSDGAHFELSPMYHQIIFFRVLELIDWYTAWEKKDGSFETFLRGKAPDMLAWLKNISFKNGDIPHFNDSANGIAYSTAWLSEYAYELGVVSSDKPLGESGYRSVAQGDYELKVDFAQIGPSYQPGHAHADALSFILYYKGEPLFVEHGTSTYQIGKRRDLERSTQAHNTVVVNNTDQSEVWGGFRVARRAQTTILKDGGDGVYEAMHDGYRRYGIIHVRSFRPKESALVVEDRLSKIADAVCFLHLCPKVAILEIQDNTVRLANGVRIAFEGAGNVKVEDYDFSDSYNVYQQAKRLVIPFKKRLITSVYFGE